MKKNPLLFIIILSSFLFSSCSHDSLSNAEILNRIEKMDLNEQFLHDTYYAYSLNSEETIVFIDSSKNNAIDNATHAFLVEGGKVVYLKGIYEYEAPLIYSYGVSTDKPNFLMGKYNGKMISRIKVDDLADSEIKLVSRTGLPDLFFVYNQELSLPIDITGFSKDGTLISKTVP